jgi:dihydroorotase (multifunctional complex type)
MKQEEWANNLIADLILADTKAYIKKTIVDCNIAINNGKILKIGKEAHIPKADTKIELKHLLVMPGLIDVHVHLRDEGKAFKEDFYTGTSAAAAGGITTVLDMPNNNPVTMSAETLKNRIIAAESKVLVNVGFYSEFPKEPKQIKNIVNVGAVGFKLYMAEQIGGTNIRDDRAILEAFTTVAELERLTAVHAEDNEALKKVEDKLRQDKRNDIAAFLKAHSEEVETKAVRRLLNLARQTAMQLHFCHVSTQHGLEMINNARKSEMPVTCETTPHNLLLSTDDLKRIGTLALTMPPVRDKYHIDALWNGIRNGSIDILASDHAPHTLEEKEAETVWDVKVGIPGLETTLPLMLTEVKRGRLNIGDLVRLLAENPAKIFKLKGKGYLVEGSNADLTIVDLTKKHKIDASRFHSKAKYSPFDGREVEGVPVKTFVNGQLVMDDGEIIGKPGGGQIIRREWLEIRR